VYAGKLVFVSYSKKENKYLLDAYIRYLCARAAGHNVTLHFISLVAAQIFTATTFTQALALEKLREIVALYKQGHEQIIPFFPGFDIKPAKVDDLDEKELNKLLKKHFNSDNNSSADEYLLHEEAFGFFEEPGIVERMQAAGEVLIKSLADFYPGYYKE
jgi:exodeoxyribonuclease V gamma subunit